jgi:hypothetical protein
MYTEIKMETKGLLPGNLKSAIDSYFNPSSKDKEAVLDQTIFRGSQDLIPNIIYAYYSHDKVFLVFTSDSRTLKIHVEHSNEKNRFDLLMHCVDDTFGQFKSFLGDEGMAITSAKASVHSEKCNLLTGVYVTKWKRFLQLLKGEVFLEIYVPLTTFIVSYMMGREIETSLYNMLMSIVATFVWLLIKTFFSKDGLKYETTI